MYMYMCMYMCVYIRTYHTLHYLTLPYIALHYLTLHYIYTIPYHYVPYHTIPCQTVALHYIALHCITFNYITLHYTHTYIYIHYIIIIYYIYIYAVDVHKGMWKECEAWTPGNLQQNITGHSLNLFIHLYPFSRLAGLVYGKLCAKSIQKLYLAISFWRKPNSPIKFPAKSIHRQSGLMTDKRINLLETPWRRVLKAVDELLHGSCWSCAGGLPSDVAHCNLST